jgi:hypothetical protein
MKKSFCLLTGLALASVLFAQKMPELQTLLNSASDPANTAEAVHIKSSKSSKTSATRLHEYYSQPRTFEHLLTSLGTASYPKNNGDTLWVGIAPYPDSLVITGTQTYSWPIIVINRALLRFKNAHATIHGDLIAFGQGKIIADHSTLVFPQQYFYQRNIILVQNASFLAQSDTLNYGGYVHNMTLMDSASLNFTNVYQTDWMTTGVSRNAQVAMHGTNIAGEFIITDHAKLNFVKCTQLLLWHVFPDTALINWSFPPGAVVNGYAFDKNKAGVKGIEYAISADSCYQVMWGLMPADGSNITISNSVIRAIGLWFEKNNSVSVSGLVDGTHYPNFLAPVSDRTLKLINDSVITWSLYPMHKSKIKVSNSTVGEIGAFGTSQVNGNLYSVDGTGGYHFSSDTSSTFANALFATCNIRSERSGIFVLANSNLYSGIASAIGQSVLIVLQSQLSQDPVPFDKSVVWNANIAQLSNTSVDSLITVGGSAWIDKMPASQLMDFKSYQLLYQKQGAAGWTAIGPARTYKIRNGLLENWNTKGLSPGNYVLNLKLKDSWGDSASAIRNVNLVPFVMAVTENKLALSMLRIYPNPSSSEFTLELGLSEKTGVIVSILDPQGKEVLRLKRQEFAAGIQLLNINMAALPSGMYFCCLSDGEHSIYRKIILNNPSVSKAN